VAFVRTDVSEERSASIVRLTRVDEPGTTLAVTSNRRTLLVTANVASRSPILITLKTEAIRSSETSVLTRATRRNITEDGIFQLQSKLRFQVMIFSSKMLHCFRDASSLPVISHLHNIVKQYKSCKLQSVYIVTPVRLAIMSVALKYVKKEQ
jgi:hypothetical protein